MIASSGYYVARPGWSGKVMRSPKGRAVVYAAAGALRDSVESFIPVRTGETVDEEDLTVRRRTSHGLPAARIITHSSIWHIIEYGSVNNPPYRPFARGADALGFPFISNGGGD